MAEICSMACVGASPQVHIIFSCKSDSAITNVHPFVCPSVLKTPFNLHLSILTLHLSIIILHFATSKLFSLFQSHPLSYSSQGACHYWILHVVQYSCNLYYQPEGCIRILYFFLSTPYCKTVVVIRRLLFRLRKWLYIHKCPLVS